MSEEKKGKGRPRKNTASRNDEFAQNENEQFSDNNENVNSDIPEDVNSSVSDIPDNDDDLKGFIKKDKIKKPLSESNIGVTDNDIDDELDLEIKEFESQEGLNDIPADNYNPLKEAVKKRGYTDGSMGLKPDENVVYTQEQGNGKTEEQVISEPNYGGGGHSKKPDIDATLINPSNSGGDGVLDIPDNDNYYNNQQNQTKKPNNNNNNNTTNNNNNSGGGNNTAKSEKKEEKESNLKDLSPAEKRKEVEKTADALLLAYKNYVPMGFTYFASHDVSKLKEMEKKGQIDLATPMNRSGGTILDYIKEYNEGVEEAFRITDAEIEAIKPALVDVLMEKEIAFTPTQKLIFVLGQFLVAKIMLLIKFIRQKNSDIKEFKKMHLEVMERAEEIRLQNEALLRQQEEILAEMRKNNGSQQNQKTQPQQQNNDNGNLRVVKEESLKKDEVVTDLTSVSETKNNVTTTTEEKTPTLDDALETNVTEVVENENKENDIPN